MRDESGEGALLAEAALHNPATPPLIVRGSKMLAEDNWNGHDVRMLYRSSVELFADLRAYGIEYVVLDQSDAAWQLPYFAQADELTRNRLELVRSQQPIGPGPRRPLSLYRVPLDPAAPVRDLPARQEFAALHAR